LMKKIFRTFYLTILIVIAGSIPAEAGPLFPAWQEGETWTVKAVYPSPLKDEWSDPVFWEYRVVSREEDGEGFYLIEINDQNGSLKLSARLFYRREDLSLARVEISKTRRGQEVVRVLTYERGYPVETEQTLTPFDTPVFPLFSPSSAQFSATRKVSEGLKTTETIKQEVRRVSGTEELPDWPTERELIEVRCTGDEGRIIFVQYWDRELPWPVYGENRNMKYWRVRE